MRPSSPVYVTARRAVRAALGAGLCSVLIATLVAASGPATAVGTPPDDATRPSTLATVSAERLPDRIALPRGFEPEGIASDARGRYYVGSLVGRGIATGSLRTGGSRILVRLPGTSLRGMTLDPRTGLLWVVGSRGERGIVRVVDPAARRPVVARVALPAAVFPNDISFSGNAAYVTDSGRQVLYRVTRPLGDRDATVRALRLRGDVWPAVAPGEIGPNGIRTAARGRLVVVDSRTGALHLVRPGDGRTTRLPVRGRLGLRSGDGLVRVADRLYVVRGRDGDQVVPVQLRRGKHGLVGVTRRALRAPGLDVPSTATRDRGSLWAVNARFGTDTDRYSLTRLPLR